MFINELVNIGFSENEAKIYLLLLKHSDLTAGKIAKKANLPRATVYSIIDNLIDKRMVISSPVGRIKYFSAELPDILNDIIGKEEEIIQQKKKEIKKLLPQLKSIKRDIELPEIVYYEGSKALRSILYKDAKPQSHIYEIGDWEVFGSYAEKYKNERLKGRSFLDLIVPDSTRARQEQKKDGKFARKQYLVKDKNFKAPVMITVSDHHVSIFILEKEKPFSIKIRNKKIIETLKSLFELAMKNYK